MLQSNGLIGSVPVSVIEVLLWLQHDLCFNCFRFFKPLEVSKELHHCNSQEYTLQRLVKCLDQKVTTVGDLVPSGFSSLQIWRFGQLRFVKLQILKGDMPYLLLGCSLSTYI